MTNNIKSQRFRIEREGGEIFLMKTEFLYGLCNSITINFLHSDSDITSKTGSYCHNRIFMIICLHTSSTWVRNHMKLKHTELTQKY